MAQLLENIRKQIPGASRFVIVFLKWSVFAAILGVVCGLVGTAFHLCVEYATHFRGLYPWLLYLLPLGGLFIVFLYQRGGLKKDPGTNKVISSVYQQDKLPYRLAPLIFIATSLTHLFGGSAGREGAALQLGGSLGAMFSRLFRIPEEERGIITMCGMSAVFSALFGTPVTAAVFSMEVISIGIFHYSAFVPCITSALVAFFITRCFHIEPTAFLLKSIPGFSPISGLQVVVLAAACAVLSILFCIAMRKTHHVLQKKIPNPYIRVLAGAFCIILLTLLVGTRDYNGAGMNIVERALAGDARPEAFFFKIVFTAITLGVGFKGGEIVPTFFVGATFGNVVGGLLGLDPGFGAAVGLVSMFCGVVNCPIASLLLSIELFGSQGMLLFALACAVSYTLSGYYGLYSTQKILYSKLRPKFVNRSTR